MKPSTNLSGPDEETQGFFHPDECGDNWFLPRDDEMMIFGAFQDEMYYKWFDRSKLLLVFLNIKKKQEVTFLRLPSNFRKKRKTSVMFFLVGCWVPTSPIRPSGHELHVILTVVPCAVIPCNFHGIAVALRGAFLEVGDKLLVKPEFRCKLQKLRDSSGLEFVLFGPSLFAHCLKHTYCHQVLGESLRTLLSQGFTHDFSTRQIRDHGWLL